jgi:hypothetical protein
MERIATFILLLALVGIGCAPMSVKIDRDDSYNVRGKLTFNLLPNEQDETISLVMNKATIDNIVTESIESDLSNKGYQKSSDNPDILVSYYLVTNAKTDFYVVNDYYGNLGYKPPRQSATRDSYHFHETTYEEGILIIDVIDTASKQRVWQGFLTTRMDVYKKDERKERRLQNGVTKILSHFPNRKT